MEIDVARKRIGLSMRLDATAGAKLGTDPNLSLRKNSGSVPNLARYAPNSRNEQAAPNAMMAAFAKLKK
jgi:transcriptional accessory protein Tex/SPT6